MADGGERWVKGELALCAAHPSNFQLHIHIHVGQHQCTGGRPQYGYHQQCIIEEHFSWYKMCVGVSDGG